MSRYDTSLESAGAEHLVIGRLLISKIQAFRAQANQPGYDIIAVEPKTGKTLKIEVKSRVAIDSGDSKIKNIGFDFVVIVRLNRGFRKELKIGVRKDLDVQFYVIPVSVIKAEFNGVIKISPKWLREHDKFFEAWHLIENALSVIPGEARKRRGKGI